MVRKFIPLVTFFVFITIMLFIAKDLLQQRHIDMQLVLIGNVLLFLTSLVSSFLYARAVASQKTIGFLQQFYGGFMLKFLVLIAAVALYLYFTPSPNQNGIFVCMALYLVYHFLGTMSATHKKPADKP